MGFSSNIHEYDLLSPIGGVDDISFMYLSRYNPTKEYVALVYTDLTISQDIEFIDELTATIRNTKLLKHPNIMPMLNSFVENERLWVVTKPVHAGSFHGLLKNHFPHGLPEPAVATVIKEVLKALVYLHKGCHIHNDIRAENILLTGNGEVQIAGFHQLTTLLQQGKYRQSVFEFVGEIEWMAPEVIVQHANHDSKIDIYSLGITALQLAYGKTPFDEWPPLKVLLSKLEHECPIYLSQDKVLSKSFFSMVSLCLQRNPGLRPSARELLDHTFFKQAKNEAYLKSCIVDGCGIMAKHASDAAKIQSQQQQQQQQQQYKKPNQSDAHSMFDGGQSGLLLQVPEDGSEVAVTVPGQGGNISSSDQLHPHVFVKRTSSSSLKARARASQVMLAKAATLAAQQSKQSILKSSQVVLEGE